MHKSSVPSPTKSRHRSSKRIVEKHNQALLKGTTQTSIVKYIRSCTLSTKEEAEWRNDLIDLDIHRAAFEGNLSLLRFLLQQQGVDPDSKGTGGKTALHFAARCPSSQPAVFGLLLACGADIEAVDATGRTPLILAAMEGSHKSVRALLSEGANVDAKDRNGDTPLHWAASRGSVEIVEILLSHRGDLESKGRYGWSPLFGAVSKDHLPVVKLLLDAGADTAAKTSWGSTAYDVASRLQHFELLPLLNKGNQACQNKENEIKEKELSVIEKYLRPKDSIGELDMTLTTKAFPEGTDSDIHFAAAGGRIDILESLLRKGVDPNSKGRGGRTPLHLVATKFSLKAIALLVAYGADIESIDDEGKTPLHLACKLGRVRALLADGADKEAKDNSGDTPLHFAAWSGCLDTVGLLLLRRVAVDPKGKYGWTPLFRAVARGHQEVVKALLKAGADKDAKNYWGSTIFDLASRLGHSGIMDIYST